MSAPRELLEIHGVVLATSELEADARRWAARTGLPILFRSRREVILGEGPEPFVQLRRFSGPARIEEVHLAVRGFSSRGPPRTRSAATADDVERRKIFLILREFRRGAGKGAKAASAGTTRRNLRSAKVG